MLRKAKGIGASASSAKSTSMGGEGHVASIQVPSDPALAAKAAEMHEEIESRRQLALARRAASQQQQTESVESVLTEGVSEKQSVHSSPQEERGGGDFRVDATTPSTVARRFQPAAWLPAGSRMRSVLK